MMTTTASGKCLHDAFDTTAARALRCRRAGYCYVLGFLLSRINRAGCRGGLIPPILLLLVQPCLADAWEDSGWVLPEDEQGIRMFDPERIVLAWPVIEKDDPDYATAYRLMVEIAGPAEGRKSQIIFHPPQRIAAPSLERLLPGYRFIVVDWERPEPAAGEPTRSVAIFHYILSVTPAGEVRRLLSYRIVPELGNLLAGERVEVHGNEDARLIWDALCIFHGSSQHAGHWPVEQVSDTIWHLGIRIDEAGGSRFFRELTLDKESRVVSLHDRSEELEKGD